MSCKACMTSIMVFKIWKVSGKIITLMAATLHHELNVVFHHDYESHLLTAVQVPLSHVGQKSHETEAEVFRNWEKIWAAEKRRNLYCGDGEYNKSKQTSGLAGLCKKIIATL